MSWYTLALIALVLYGVQNFLYKVAAEKKCNTAITMVSFTATAGVLGGIFFFLSKETIADVSFLLWLSLVGAVMFVAALITRVEALKNVSSTVAYPITRLSIVFVVLFALFYFQESLSMYQAAGIGLAMAALLLLARNNHQERMAHPNYRAGVMLAIASLFLAAGATIISKFVAISFESFFAFIALSGAFGMMFAFALKGKLQREKENPDHRNAILIGGLAGLFNFVGFYVILRALSVGPLSIVASIQSMNFVIAIFLAVLVYKEELTRRRLAGIGLTIVALVLLRIS